MNIAHALKIYQPQSVVPSHDVSIVATLPASRGFWSPGMGLMRNLGFAAKAFTISLMFLIPLVVLSYFFGISQTEQINFSDKERVGVAALKQFLPVSTGVLKTRNATQAILGGFEGHNQYVSGRSQTDQALMAFDKYLANSGDELGLKPEFEKLKSTWAATSQSKDGADSQGHTVLDPVSASISATLNLIGDNSNLVLDPDLDSYYLVDAMVLAMPRLADDLGQLWGWGTHALAHPGLSVDDEKRYMLWAVGVEFGLNQSRSFLKKVIVANPSLESKLNLSLFDELGAFHQFAKDHEALINNNALTPQLYFEKGETAVLKLQSFYDQGLPTLDGLLVDRIDTMTHRMAWIAGAVVIALLLASYFFYSFFLVTRGGLQLISKHLHEMASGDLRHAPRKPLGKDETATVIQDLRTAYDSILGLIQKVRISADSLQRASSDIATASMDLSARTEATAASLEEQASAMEEIGTTVGATSERAQMASNFATDNADVAQRAGKLFAEVVHTMHDIHASSTKINDIISVINGIAFQTNILALNAAVEAARAGEQGRGFAVVASEVRNLAGRSADAAKEIKNLISNSVEQVEGGTKRVEEAGETMGRVIANAKEIHVFLSQISTNSREQASGVEQVTQAIQLLDKNTQKNVALVEQTSAASGSLSGLAETLQGELGNFLLV